MTKPIWMIQQSTKPKTLELYVYDDVKDDEENWWTGEVKESKTSAKYIQAQLEEYKDISNIDIFINSYGGSVKEGLAVYNQLKRHPAQKTVYIDGFACSIASVIAMAGDKVIMGTNTLMMIHHASMGAYGNAEELRKAANDVEVIDQASCSSYLEKAGDKLSQEELTKLLDNQTWLNAEQCLQYGLADEIAGKEDKSIEEAKQRFEQSVRYQVEQSKKDIEVPKEFTQQKTNAEKIMMAFKQKEREDNE